MKPRSNQRVRTVSARRAKAVRVFYFTAFLVICMGIGAASWAIPPLVSSTVEPWNSWTGIIINQALLCITAFIVGKKSGARMMSRSVLCLYIGQNVFIYIFGCSEHRSYTPLLLITTAALFILPLLTGFIGTVCHLIRVHHILLISRKERIS